MTNPSYILGTNSENFISPVSGNTDKELVALFLLSSRGIMHEIYVAPDKSVAHYQMSAIKLMQNAQAGAME